MKKKLKAVLFDMDGVLFNSMPYHSEAWHQVMKTHGLDLSREEASTAIGQSTTSQRYNGITAIDGFTIGNSIVTATGTSYGIYANSYNNCDIRGKDTVIKVTSTGGELAVYSQYPTAYYPYYGSINLYDDLCVTVSLHS